MKRFVSNKATETQIYEVANVTYIDTEDPFTVPNTPDNKMPIPQQLRQLNRAVRLVLYRSYTEKKESQTTAKQLSKFNFAFYMSCYVDFFNPFDPFPFCIRDPNLYWIL